MIIGRVIEQHQLPRKQAAVVPVIVHVPDVLGPRRGNRAVCFEPRAVYQEHVARRRIELVFVHVGGCTADRLQDSIPRQLGGTAKQADLASAFHAAQAIQNRREIPYLARRIACAKKLYKMRLAGNAAVPVISGNRCIRRHQLPAALLGAFRGGKRRVNDAWAPPRPHGSSSKPILSHRVGTQDAIRARELPD